MKISYAKFCLSIIFFLAFVFSSQINAEIPAHVIKNINERCVVCHGEQGESSSPLFPKLAGSNYQYFAKQLNDFINGVRKTRTMTVQLRDIDPEDFEYYGIYYEQLKSTAEANLGSIEKGKELYENGRPEMGIIACKSCHGEKGYGSSTLPRLAGQIPEYTKRQLEKFSQRQRTNDNAVMQDIANNLSEEDILEVAKYLAVIN